MSSQSKRLATLGKRFEQTARPSGGGEDSNNTRKRHSIYIDQVVMQRVDELYKQTQHEFFPTEITKSAFLEQLLEQGLEHIDKVKVALAG